IELEKLRNVDALASGTAANLPGKKKEELIKSGKFGAGITFCYNSGSSSAIRRQCFVLTGSILGYVRFKFRSFRDKDPKSLIALKGLKGCDVALQKWEGRRLYRVALMLELNVGRMEQTSFDSLVRSNDIGH
ncbi:hypothetical protein WUBG_07721, partial [Wuchereria bancrofti]